MGPWRGPCKEWDWDRGASQLPRRHPLPGGRWACAERERHDTKASEASSLGPSDARGNRTLSARKAHGGGPPNGGTEEAFPVDPRCPCSRLPDPRIGASAAPPPATAGLGPAWVQTLLEAQVVQQPVFGDLSSAAPFSADGGGGYLLGLERQNGSSPARWCAGERGQGPGLCGRVVRQKTSQPGPGVRHGFHMTRA
jgi:hypothetical protein